jgi:hypothetical protein
MREQSGARKNLQLARDGGEGRLPLLLRQHRQQKAHAEDGGTDDVGVAAADIDTITKWVDAGAPEGNPTDAPPAVRWPDGGWHIEPDYIVEGPDYEVSAKGVVESIWFVVPTGLTKDTWVTSIEVLSMCASVSRSRRSHPRVATLR